MQQVKGSLCSSPGRITVKPTGVGGFWCYGASGQTVIPSIWDTLAEEDHGAGKRSHRSCGLHEMSKHCISLDFQSDGKTRPKRRGSRPLGYSDRRVHGTRSHARLDRWVACRP